LTLTSPWDGTGLAGKEMLPLFRPRCEKYKTPATIKISAITAMTTYFILLGDFGGAGGFPGGTSAPAFSRVSRSCSAFSEIAGLLCPAPCSGANVLRRS